MQRLRHIDRAMIRWICGIKDRDETSPASLLQKLLIGDVTLVLHCRRLRWYGYVQQVTSCIKSTTHFPIPGTRKQAWARKTWSSKCVAWLALTQYTEMHGDPMFDIAWSSQPHKWHTMDMLWEKFPEDSFKRICSFRAECLYSDFPVALFTNMVQLWSQHE